MAVFKIFPEKDATIYYTIPAMNTGRDEILEASTLSNPLDNEEAADAVRFLIKFPSDEIQDVIENKIASSSYSASLKIYFAEGTEMPLDYDLFCYPVYQSWDMGTGKFLDIPRTTNGVNWTYTGMYNSSSAWQTSSLPPFVTNNYPVSGTAGGGTWYTGSLTLNPVASQSFTFVSSKDIDFNVTNAVSLMYDDYIGNYGLDNQGFIVKLQDSLEFSQQTFQLRYFSMDTNTIYPPHLEFRWDDYVFNTGSSTGTIVTGSNIVVNLSNNKREFRQNSIQKFRLRVRDRFPARAFVTSSVYLTNNYLPTASYYSIVDLDTAETVIDFDTNFTKISADSESNYFTLYCSGLEPERYYKLVVKTTIDGEEIYLDDDYYFKVIR